MKCTSLAKQPSGLQHACSLHKATRHRWRGALPSQVASSPQGCWVTAAKRSDEGSWRRLLLLLLDRVQHRKEQGWVARRGHRLAGRVGRKDSCCPAQLRSSALQKQQLLLATELKALPTFSLQCPCPCVLRGQRGRDVETCAWLGGERFCRISEKLLTVDAWRNCQPKPNHR